MDINEIPDRQIRRHPWELSRTESVLWELGRFLPDKKKKGICIDFGAGDQFFDDALLSAYPNMSVIAVDVGYTPDALGSLPARKNAERIQTALSLSDVSETGAEFALMMDSLEYITDEAACIRELA
ncbi:MAG: hypothetical protein IJS90_10315, partial [Clostridia bacterium]|nr:hypothetical protein [Clostridia bacterium]